MQNVVLLTQENIAHVKAGVEVYSEQLRFAFANLAVIDFNRADFNHYFQEQPLSFLWREPLRAQAVQKCFLDWQKENDVSLILANGMFAWYLKGLKTEIPIIGINHGTYPGLANCAFPFGLNRLRTQFVYAHYEKKSFQSCSQVVSNSVFSNENLKKYYGLEGRVIYNGIDPEIFKPMDRGQVRDQLSHVVFPKNQKVVLFVGRPDYSKGFDIVEQLAAKHSDVFFICVSFPKANLERENMLCLESVSHRDLALFYNACDVVLFPSRFEGFGYVSLEALACNRKVVAYYTGIVREIRHENLYVVSNHSLSDFSAQLKQALAKSEQAEDSHGFVKKQFSVENFVKNFRNLASELI